MITYPSYFPKPLKPPYQYVVDAGLSRSDIGYTEQVQRRLYGNMPNLASIQFAIPINQLNAWIQWVNQNAYQYFIIKAFLSNCGPCGDVYLRFAGDVSMAPLTPDALTVSVQADLLEKGIA